MATKPPTKAARDFSFRLRAALDALPSSRDDKPGYEHGIEGVRHLILAEGGRSTEQWNGARVRIHGFSATSTMGLAAACRNWITQVTLKSASAAMTDHGPWSAT